MDITKMSPRRPYMLRAFYEWLIENELTPHVVVDATLAGVKVPDEFVQDGQIVLNIAPRAVGNLELGNEVITFQARFSGRPHSVIVPLYAVQAIYARENGAGTMFEPEEAYLALMDGETLSEPLNSTRPKLTSVPRQNSGEEPLDTAPEMQSNATKKPTLRVIK